MSAPSFMHDPLCPMSEPCGRDWDPGHTERWAGDVCDWCEDWCRCDLITKVREEEQTKARVFYENPCAMCGFDDWSTYVCDECLADIENTEDSP